MIGALIADATAVSTPTVALVWSAPVEACPDSSYVLAQIDRFLSGRASALPDRAVKVTASVEPSPEGFQVSIVTDTGDTRDARTFTNRECKALARATALMTALVINPEKVVATSSDEDAPPPAPPPRPTPPPPPPAPPPVKSTPAQQERFVRWHVSLLGALELRTTPGLLLGAHGLVGASLGPVRLEGSGTWLPDREADVSSLDPDEGVSFRKAGAGLRVCGELLDDRDPIALQMGPCVGIEANNLRARTFGIVKPSEGSGWWAEATAGIFDELRLSEHWSLVSRVDLGFPLQNREFLVRGVGIVHTIPSFTFHAALGIGVRF